MGYPAEQVHHAVRLGLAPMGVDGCDLIGVLVGDAETLAHGGDHVVNCANGPADLVFGKSRWNGVHRLPGCGQFSRLSQEDALLEVKVNLLRAPRLCGGQEPPSDHEEVVHPAQFRSPVRSRIVVAGQQEPFAPEPQLEQDRVGRVAAERWVVQVDAECAAVGMPTCDRHAEQRKVLVLAFAHHA